MANSNYTMEIVFQTMEHIYKKNDLRKKKKNRKEKLKKLNF